jgi:AcrR family transcriptional regulator
MSEPPPDGRTGLPVLGLAAPPRERADAAQNRRRILAAAAELFAERGVGAVSMDDVAHRAGVGKGTLYRRFGDRSGLATALLDERERELQQAILAGPPPLGPGAPPADRLAAFVEAYLGYVDATLDVVLLSQTSTPGARHGTGAHVFWTTHCRLQLAAAGAPDPEVRADVLLAGLTAEQVRQWRRVEERPLDDLATRLRRVAHALAGAGAGD